MNVAVNICINCSLYLLFYYHLRLLSSKHTKIQEVLTLRKQLHILAFDMHRKFQASSFSVWNMEGSQYSIKDMWCCPLSPRGQKFWLRFIWCDDSYRLSSWENLTISDFKSCDHAPIRVGCQNDPHFCNPDPDLSIQNTVSVGLRWQGCCSWENVTISDFWSKIFKSVLGAKIDL